MREDRRFAIIIGVLVITFILAGGMLIGKAAHAVKEQENKFQIECIQAGGTPSYERMGNKLICS